MVGVRTGDWTCRKEDRQEDRAMRTERDTERKHGDSGRRAERSRERD